MHYQLLIHLTIIIAGSSHHSQFIKTTYFPNSISSGLIGQAINDVKENIVTNTAMAFSPTGNLLSVGMSDGTIKILNVKEGIELSTFKKHTKNILSLLFSHDAKYLISASGDDDIILWDVERKKYKHMITLKEPLEGIVYLTKDEKYIVNAKHSIISSTNTLLHRFVSIIYWETATGCLAGELDYAKSRNYLPNNLDGSMFRLVTKLSRNEQTKQYHKVVIGDSKENKVIFEKTIPSLISFVMSDNQNYIATADGHGVVSIWEFYTGNLISHIKTNVLVGNCQDVTGFVMTLSPKGNRLALAFNSSDLEIWDISEPKNPTVKRVKLQKDHEIVDGNLKIVISRRFTTYGAPFFTTIKRKRETTEEGKIIVTWTIIQEFTTEELTAVKKLLEQANNWISVAKQKKKK